MRKWVLLMVTIVIMTAFAGCLGGEAENKGNSQPELVLKQGTIPQQSGWIDTDGNRHAHGEFTINLNDTNIVSVNIKLSVEDSDAAHAETDEGSDPDDVIVTVGQGNNSEEKTGMTPFNQQFDIGAPKTEEKTDYLGESWTIVIDAALGGEKPAYFFGLIVWEDQGVAYTIDGSYSYMASEETG